MSFKKYLIEKTETADEMYKRISKEVDVLINLLQKKLKIHSDKQKRDKDNYGYAGDIGQVKEILSDIIKFIQ